MLGQYPADKKSPKGKLRVLYEGFPMAMLTEQARRCDQLMKQCLALPCLALPCAALRCVRACGTRPEGARGVAVPQAGGTASTGMFEGKVQRILDLLPANIHDRCPIIMGCNADCERVLSIYKK